VPQFKLKNILLEISGQHLSSQIRKELTSGKFEHQEVAALRSHLCVNDRLLEIGTGVGYTTIVATGIIAGENITSVEANPLVFPDIRTNFALNNVQGVTLINCAATPDSCRDSIPFFVPKAFYAASVYGEHMPYAKRIEVPARPLLELLVESAATVLLCDAEGAEMQFFFEPLPARLRLIILEVHPNKFSEDEIEAVFDRLVAQGFAPSIDGTNWPVVCFERH